MASAEIVDLRSDTVTRPSPGMRRAIAEAEVGDDVFGEDPTVNRLQDAVAELLGTEDAIFVPTGTMANQIAIAVHTRPGDEIIVGRGAHTWLFETGAAAAISGVQPCLIGDDGRFTAEELRSAYKPDNHHYPPSRMMSVENTHNMGGGLVWDTDDLAAVIATANDLGLGKHLDGARIWNAAVASGRSEAALAQGFDTVAVCLSKGLGAPVGSVMAGTKQLVNEAHRMRKRLGGGMRQAGILAAAGLYALEHNRARLPIDHDNATYLGEAVNALPGLTVDRASVQTNIVMVDTDGDAAAIASRAAERGLHLVALGPKRIRLVTHLDVDRAACERGVSILEEICAG